MLAIIISSLAKVIAAVLQMLTLLIFVSVAISWLSADPRNPIVNFIHMVTEPIYRPIRRYTSRIGGPIDFAPMAALLIIMFLGEVIPGLLGLLEMQLR